MEEKKSEEENVVWKIEMVLIIDRHISLYN